MKAGGLFNSDLHCKTQTYTSFSHQLKKSTYSGLFHYYSSSAALLQISFTFFLLKNEFPSLEFRVRTDVIKPSSDCKAGIWVICYKNRISFFSGLENDLTVWLGIIWHNGSYQIPYNNLLCHIHFALSNSKSTQILVV